MLAFVIRVQLAQQPLWIDELHTAWVVDGDWSEVAQRARLGNQSPLFFYFEKAMVSWLGFSPLTLRTIPLIASVLQIAVVFWVLNRWTGASAAGVVAAFLMLINPIQLFTGTDARPYALIGLVACIQVGALVKHWQDASRGKDSHWGFDVVWVSSNVLLFYLHYTTIFWIAAIWLGLCWMSATVRPRPQSKRLVWWLVIEPVIIAVLCMPGLFHLVSLLPDREQWSSFIRIERFWINMQGIVFVLLIGPLLSMIVLQSLYLLKPKQGWATTRNLAWQPLVVLTLSGLVVPPIIAAVLTGWNIVPVAFYRYAIASLTAGFFLPGLIVGIWKWPRVRWMMTSLIIAIGLATNMELLSFVWTGRLPQLHDENWERVSTTIRNQNQGHDYPVILCPALVEDRRLIADLLPPEVELRRAFQRYCTYALDGPYRIFNDPEKNGEMVFARPTDPSTRFNLPRLAQIQQAKGTFLVVRGDSEVARKMAGQVKRIMSVNEKYPTTVTEIYSVPVNLFRIEYSEEGNWPPPTKPYQSEYIVPGWDVPPQPRYD